MHFQKSMKIITYLSDKNKGERGLVRLGGGGGSMFRGDVMLVPTI